MSYYGATSKEGFSGARILTVVSTDLLVAIEKMSRGLTQVLILLQNAGLRPAAFCGSGAFCGCLDRQIDVENPLVWPSCRGEAEVETIQNLGKLRFA